MGVSLTGLAVGLMGRGVYFDATPWTRRPSIPRDDITPCDGPPVLVIDAASPVVSVAVGTLGEAGSGRARLLAERSLELRRSSERLLPLLDEALEEAGLAVADLSGLVALRGPGSFTGLRVGLATVLGFHQATGVPATTVDTPDVLAWSLALRPKVPTGTVAAAVDALRGEWFVRGFHLTPTGPEPVESPDGDGDLLASAGLVAAGFEAVVGFGVRRLAETDAWRQREERDAPSPELVEPGALAPAGLDLAAATLGPPEAWDGRLLTRPLYARPPAVSLPARPKRVGD